MGRITFIQPDGERVSVPIRPGNNIMEAAVAGEILGIEAQCYGAGVCGTCHVFVPEALAQLLPAPNTWEQDMLSCLELAGPGSRLACQVRFTDELDGAEFTAPERQDAIS